MIKLPQQLQKTEFGFCRIIAGTKRPEGDAWQEKPYRFDDPDFKKYLEKAEAYGVCCGYGALIIIDADSPKIEEVIENHFPRTFVVKTGSGKKHFYFLCPDWKDSRAYINLEAAP